ncbi:DUF6538 domain-containing protein [Methylobacterium sp. 10]|uniref:DUF6538 domain-containing protein n=1 Tax=Methylobacterium sp. 10 TaxID=1101191 RepID=UPI0032AEBF4A
MKPEKPLFSDVPKGNSDFVAVRWYTRGSGNVASWPHPKTGVFWFRKRIPKDLMALVGKREEKASLGTKDVGEAKRRHAAYAALVEARWANLRVGVRQLSLLEVNGIAGEFYEDLIPRFQAGKFSPSFNLMSSAMIYRYVDDPSPAHRTQFLRFHGKDIDAYLVGKGLVIHPDTRGALDLAIAKAISGRRPEHEVPQRGF